MYGAKNNSRRSTHSNIDAGRFWCDVLCHWGIKEDHKYIAKVRISNGKYRYFYDKEEYAAYLKNKGNSESTMIVTGSDMDNTTSPIPKTILTTVEDTANQNVQKVDLELATIQAGKQAFSNVINVLSNVKTLEKEPFDLGKFVTKNIVDPLSNLVSPLFGNKEENKEHKYLAKVQLSNGEFRYFYDQKEYDAYLTRQKYQENEPDFMKDIAELDANYNSIDDVIRTNPKYSEYSTEYSTNCWLSSNAYELRKRGYDVEASAMDSSKIDWVTSKYKKGDSESFAKGHEENFKRWYKNPVTVPINKPAFQMEDAIRNNVPNNSRGQMNVEWEYGGGHSVVWEVDRNNNLTIIDSQTHKTYSTHKEIQDFANRVKMADYTRTDNLELEEGILDVVDEKRKR